MNELENLINKYKNEGKDKIAKNLENLRDCIRKQEKKEKSTN